MAGPHFFVDRSLGRHRVPNLLRKDGWSPVTLAEHDGIPADEAVADVDWLELAGQNRRPVLMKDEKIRYRPAERAAVRAHDVRAFYLTSSNPHRSAEWPTCSSPIAMSSGGWQSKYARHSSPSPAVPYVRLT
jgi:hypothetical protein